MRIEESNQLRRQIPDCRVHAGENSTVSARSLAVHIADIEGILAAGPPPDGLDRWGRIPGRASIVMKRFRECSQRMPPVVNDERRDGHAGKGDGLADSEKTLADFGGDTRQFGSLRAGRGDHERRILKFGHDEAPGPMRLREDVAAAGGQYLGAHVTNAITCSGMSTGTRETHHSAPKLLDDLLPEDELHVRRAAHVGGADEEHLRADQSGTFRDVVPSRTLATI